MFPDFYNGHIIQDIKTSFQEEVKPYDSISQLAIQAESYLLDLFNIKIKFADLKKKLLDYTSISICQKKFLQKISYRDEKISYEEYISAKHDLKKILLIKTEEISDLIISKHISIWLQDAKNNIQQLSLAKKYFTYRLLNKEKYNDSQLLKIPRPLDYNLPYLQNIKNNTPILNADKSQHIIHSCNKIKSRNGFNYTNKPPTLLKVSLETNYCLICHKRNRDSCSKGKYKSNQIEYSQSNVMMQGCPLQQKISEINELFNQGHFIAAFIMILLDNPMCAATGQHICHECQTSCIFQKQTPVEITSIESYIFDYVLSLPYGFEIYSLLSRWNPLNIQPLYNIPVKKNILISGMGPAGFTLSYYMLNAGFNVVGVDGIKIENLPIELAGKYDKKTRKKVGFERIKNIKEYFCDLQKRTIYGFGGVMEYGITSRWDKNLLLIIRLLLERRDNFLMKGNIMVNHNNYDYFLELGFQHIALTTGAGNPKYLHFI